MKKLLFILSFLITRSSFAQSLSNLCDTEASPEAVKIKTYPSQNTTAQIKYQIPDNSKGDSLVGKEKFKVASGNEQGLAYRNNIIYIGYDIGSGNSRFNLYNFATGALIKSVSPIACGHATDMAYDDGTGLLYVSNANVGIKSGHIYAININDTAPSIQKDYDVSFMGANGALVALDQENNKLYLTGDIGIVSMDLATGVFDTANKFKVSFTDVLQGSCYYNKKLYLLGGERYIKIITIDVDSKTIENVVQTKAGSEPEGIAYFAEASVPTVIVGFAYNHIFTVTGF